MKQFIRIIRWNFVKTKHQNMRKAKLIDPTIIIYPQFCICEPLFYNYLCECRSMQNQQKNWMYFLFRSRLAECSCDRRKIKTEIQNKINQEDERSSDTKFAKIPTAHAQTPANTQEKNQDCDKSSTSGSGNQDPANKQGQKWTSLDLKQGFYRGVYLGLWFYYFYYEFI